MSSPLLIDEHPLTVLPSLVKLVGLNEAIVLQQIRYWLNINEKAKRERNFRDGYWWTYNTQEEWLNQFPWLSLSTLKVILKKLRKMGLIVTRAFEASKRNQTLWYRIDYEALNRLIEGPKDSSSGGSSDQPDSDYSSTVDQSESDQCNSQNLATAIGQDLTPPSVRIGLLSTETNSETNSETLFSGAKGRKARLKIARRKPEVSDRTPTRTELESTPPVQPVITQEVVCSAAISPTVEKPTDPFLAKPLPIWRTGRGVNDWNEPLLQEYCRQMDEKYEGKGRHTRADAVGFFSSRETPGDPRHAAAIARAEELLERIEARERQRQENAELVTASFAVFTAPPPPTEEELAASRAKCAEVKARLMQQRGGRQP